MLVPRFVKARLGLVFLTMFPLGAFLTGTFLLASVPLESFLPGQDVPGREARAAFDESVGEIHKKAKRGKWKSSRKALVSLIAEHADAPWILTRVGELRERLQTYAFWSSYDRPDVNDAVQGDVKKYSESNGKIEIHYDWERGESLDDESYEFFSVGDEDDRVWVHPAVFAGPYTIEIQGKGCDGQATLYGGLVTWEHFDAIVFNNSSLSALFRCRDGDFEDLDTTALSFHGERKYSFEFEVQKKRVRAAILGKKAMQTDRPKDEPWGYCGMADCKGLRKVIIRGEVDPGWVDGLIDEKVQVSRLAFEESYDENDGIPASVVALLKERPAVDSDFELAYPGEKSSGLDKKLARFWGSVEEDGEKGARFELAKLESSEPEAFTSWVAFWTELIGDDLDAANAKCDEVIGLEPDFDWAHHVRANLRSKDISPKEARAEALMLIERFPKRGEPYRRFANRLLADGELDGAKGVFDQAILAGAPPEALEPLRKTLTGAEYGPRWDRVEEWKGKQYIVRSNMAKDSAAEAGRELENSYLRWNRHLRRIPKSERGGRASVYLFGGEAGYHAYTQDILEGPAENTAGVFISSIQQLLVWNMPDRDQWKQTIRHEGFHQFLDRLAPTAPIWFHEGMAQYYETSRNVRGRWKEGDVRPDLISRLRETPMIPLKRFVALDSRGFMRNAGRNYAQAWAFVHFLQHGKDRKNKKLFDRFLDGLIEGAGAKDALAEALGDTTLESLDSKLAAYVRSLR